MADINFDTGLVEHNINGKCKVVFNPTDLSFAERIFNAFDALDAKQDAYTSKIKEEDARTVFDTARVMDAEMRELIDEAFEAPVSDAVFGKMNVYAVAGGLPGWCNLFLAVIDEMDSAFAREKKQTNPRIQKYVARYNRK